MRNVIITGASRGVGLGIAKVLAQSGYCAICVARTSNGEFERARDKIERGKTGALDFVPFDLFEIDKLSKLVDTLRERHGSIYGLVNNAGAGTGGILAVMQNAQIESLIRLNMFSPIVLTKYVARMMMAKGEGRIVNVTSIVGTSGFQGLSVYSATKAAMIGFTRSLARELGRAGINVNAVAPSFMDTEMTKDVSESQREQILRRSALRRFPEVEDVANAVEFLLSEKTRNITGTVMTVDAGSTA